jgi:hypothetical protein
VVGIFVITAFERRRHRGLAAERASLSESEFTSELVAAGVAEETARFVWNESVRYYFEPLKPDPNDYWESTMRIDPEDLDDITARFWKLQGWMEPSRKDPVMIPSDPTLLQYAQWLDRQRRFKSD